MTGSELSDKIDTVAQGKNKILCAAVLFYHPVKADNLLRLGVGRGLIGINLTIPQDIVCKNITSGTEQRKNHFIIGAVLPLVGIQINDVVDFI